MKCNMDCFNCTRPPEKCYGGTSKKAYDPEPKPKDKGIGKIIQSTSFSHKCKGIYND